MTNPMMPVPVGHCYAIFAGTVRTATSTGKTRFSGGYRQVLIAHVFGARNIWLDANQVFLSRQSARAVMLAVITDERRVS